METAAALLAVTFSGLAILHLYWAAGGTFGVEAALPAVDGSPVFTPGRTATVGVAGILGSFAVIALILGVETDSTAILMPYAVFSGFAIGTVLVLRAVGEFRYVGFFKRVKNSRFAVYDSWLFSPFCILAGGAFLVLAATRT